VVAMLKRSPATLRGRYIGIQSERVGRAQHAARLQGKGSPAR
jgi:hypothetical protein